MRKSTKQAIDKFLRGDCYTLEKLEADYQYELTRYSDDHQEAPQRAARLSAAVKRYKTSEMLRFIFATVAYKFDPDLTPLTVKRLCNSLFGRTGSQCIISEVFRTKGRLHRSDDSNPERIEQMAAKFLPDARKQWDYTLATIEKVKFRYRAEIRDRRKQQKARGSASGR